MDQSINNQLIYKQLVVMGIGLLISISLVFFLGGLLSSIKLPGQAEGQGLELPSILGYMLVVAFVLKPSVKLVVNIILIQKWKKGDVPSCPNCSYPMVKRIAKKGQFVGQYLWGCCTFPQCHGKIHIG